MVCYDEGWPEAARTTCFGSDTASRPAALAGFGLDALSFTLLLEDPFFADFLALFAGVDGAAARRPRLPLSGSARLPRSFLAVFRRFFDCRVTVRPLRRDPGF